MKDYRQIDGMIKQMDECLHHAYDRGYKKGFDDGHETGMIDGVMNIDVNEVSYVKGLNDAWECAREISLLDSNFESVEEVKNILKVFGTDNIYDILHDYTPQDVIKRIKDYEKNQKQTDKIRVGDEVRIKNTEYIGIVHHVGDDWAIVETFVGGRPHLTSRDMGDLERTGNHYDGIESILDQMRATNERNN